jgi:hypothetical protein
MSLSKGEKIAKEIAKRTQGEMKQSTFGEKTVWIVSYHQSGMENFRLTVVKGWYSNGQIAFSCGGY